MSKKQGKYKIIEQLLADDINLMFGNPGTVEQGFLDAAQSFENFEYIMALQETIAVGMADGYARTTKKPCVVQLHSGVGLGNGIGMLYQAMRGHSPLIVLTGTAGVRYDAMDAQMAADLVGMAKPVTKWASKVTEKNSVLRMLRRAIKIASTPPMGPVFLEVPMDILDEETNEEVVKTSIINTSTTPKKELVEEIANTLIKAKSPMFIVGDGIAQSYAEDELTKLAELVGADVWGADYSEVNMDATHPLFKGLLGHMFGSHSSQITSKADVVFICGTYVFPEVFPNLYDVFEKDAKIMHVDLNSYEIAKNFPVDIGIMSDPKETLKMLCDSVENLSNEEFKSNVLKKIEDAKIEKENIIKKEKEKDDAIKFETPMHPSTFTKILSEKLNLENTVIFDEALTSSPDLNRYIPAKYKNSFYQTRGGSLGVGIPGALGLKMAMPEKTVIGFTGDGGSMYTIQALWSAVHHDIDAKFVICNNHEYKLLKLNVMEYWKERDIPDHEFPIEFNICKPNIDFVKLSESMGVKAKKVTSYDEVELSIKEMLAHKGPYLIELVIDNKVEGHKNVKCGQ